MILYKIRNRVTGKYSTGGRWPKFTRCGKIWSTKQNLNQHLDLYSKESLDYKLEIYKNCEIVTYLCEEFWRKLSVSDWSDEVTHEHS